MTRLFLAVVLVVVTTLSGFAQSIVDGWGKTYPFVGEVFSEARALTQTVDNGFIFINQNNVNKFRVVKTDPDGNRIWETEELSGLTDVDAREILATDNGGYVIVANCSDCGIQANDRNVVVYWLNKHGELATTPQVIEISNAPDIMAYDGNSIAQTTDGGYIIAGYVETINLSEQAYFIKLAADGTVEFQTVLGGEGREIVRDVLETANGFIGAGSITDVNGNEDVYAVEISATGDSLWSSAYGNSASNEGFGLVPTYDNNQNVDGYLIAGYTVSVATGINAYLVELATNGDELSTTVLTDGPLAEQIFGIDNTDDGGYILTGTIEPDALSTSLLLIKLNNGLETEWEKEFGQPNQTDFTATQGLSVVQTNDEGFAIAGFQSDPDNFDQTYSYILKTDSQGQIFSNYLVGRVYNNSTDIGINDWVISAVEQGEGDRRYYTTSASDGSYELLLTTGTFVVTLHTPNEYWVPNLSSFTINIPNAGTTEDIDFPINPITDCTDLEVDISTPYVMPGQANVYTVNYCNHGPETAQDAYVEVDLDADILLLDSSIPGNDLGNNRFRFQIGDVLFGDCGTFTINAVLQASTESLATECVEAEIFPNVICGTENYDGPSVEVVGECTDSVRFQIRNTGGDMLSALNYIIVEDVVMRVEDPFQLNNGQTMDIVLPNDEGATYRIMAEQATGHPGDSRPTVAVEGCGGLHPGFYTSFPEDDYNYSNEFDCQENVPAPLSNVKRSYPKGVNDSLLVAADADLVYHLKFQNIGQDTAIRVVIRDTISPNLDPAQIRPGASSHDYDYEVYAGGILKFTFEDINLPGSSTDEIGSHVYVKYRISQKPNNEVGTSLHNGTAITFEYNAPQTLEGEPQYIGGPEVGTFLITSNENFHPAVEALHIFPNPFTDMVTFELETDVDFQDLTFTLFDVTGREVQRTQFNGRRFTLQNNRLTAGMYVFRIETADGQPVSTGKIVAQ